MTKKFSKTMLLLGFGLAFSSAVVANHTYQRSSNFSADLDGFQEVPSVLTSGSGRFKAWLSDDKLYFSFRYKNLAGQITAAHIHFAQPGVNGGVLAFICSNSNGAVSPSTNVPSCPGEGQKLQGMITGDDVLEIAGQGVTAGDFNALKQAIMAGTAYINVHTDAFPPGELRGNIEYQANNSKKTTESSGNSSQTYQRYPDNRDEDESFNESYRKYK